MSHRSQVAKSGSSPIEACSAACAAPGTSAAASPARSRPASSTVHQTARVRRWRGRQVQRLLAEHLAGDHAPAQERDHLVGHLDACRRTASRAPRPACCAVSTTSMSVTSRATVVQSGSARPTTGHLLVEVERGDQVGLALVHVDRAVVDAWRARRRRRRCRAAGRCPPRPGPPDRAPDAPDVGQVAGPLAAGSSTARPARRRSSPRLDQVVGHLGGVRPEQRAARRRCSGQLGGRGAQVRARARAGCRGRARSPRPAGRTASRGGG